MGRKKKKRRGELEKGVGRRFYEMEAMHPDKEIPEVMGPACTSIGAVFDTYIAQ